MKRLAKLQQLTCALALSTALAAPALAATSGDPVNIDVVLPSTGSLAFLGASEQHDLTIEQKVFNDGNGIHGRPINFVFHDDQSSPQIAVQISNQIIASKPKLILGSALVGLCNAMAPLMRDGPVMYCFSPGIHPDKGSYVFSSNVSTADLFNVTLRYYRLRGWTKIAMLTSHRCFRAGCRTGHQEAAGAAREQRHATGGSKPGSTRRMSAPTRRSSG